MSSDTLPGILLLVLVSLLTSLGAPGGSLAYSRVATAVERQTPRTVPEQERAGQPQNPEARKARSPGGSDLAEDSTTGDAPGYLGLVLAPIETTGGRLEVGGLEPAGPAATAGVLPGDRILRVGQQSVDGLSNPEIIRLFQRVRAGEVVHLSLNRRGVDLKLAVRAAPRPKHVDQRNQRILRGEEEKGSLARLLELLGDSETFTLRLSSSSLLTLMAPSWTKPLPVDNELRGFLYRLPEVGPATRRIEKGEVLQIRIVRSGTNAITFRVDPPRPVERE